MALSDVCHTPWVAESGAVKRRSFLVAAFFFVLLLFFLSMCW